jgi:hypothetical protein
MDRAFRTKKGQAVRPSVTLNQTNTVRTTNLLPQASSEAVRIIEKFISTGNFTIVKGIVKCLSLAEKEVPTFSLTISGEGIESKYTVAYNTEKQYGEFSGIAISRGTIVKLEVDTSKCEVLLSYELEPRNV